MKKNIIIKPQFYILIGFGIIYSLISLINHYNFRTYGFDLGIYNNTLYDYSLFQVNNNPIMHPRFNNVLSDHFSLYHYIFAPLRYIFGTYALLLIQITSLLFGGLGIRKLILFLTENKIFANLAMIHFLSMWGIFSALGFDYHDNVVATMFVPWLIRYILQKKWSQVWIWAFIIFISKENMSLWLAFVFGGIGIWKFRDKVIRNQMILAGIVSIFYFVIVMKFIMPAFANPGKEYAHFLYKSLGTTPKEILYNLFWNPKYLLSLLFENHLTNDAYNGLKTELHFMVLLSGGIAFFYKPQFFIMLIPIYAQKLFHSSFIKWGISYQYSIEFAPILTLAFFYWITQLQISEKQKRNILILGTIVCLSVTISSLYNRKSKWYDKHSHNFLIASHYSRGFSVQNVYAELEKIPKDAKVSAQNMIIPHLALREDIYMYPHVNDADYIVLLPAANTPWPLTQTNYNLQILKLENDSIFTPIVKSKDIIIFKRK